jgi:hypothetical protein
MNDLKRLYTKYPFVLLSQNYWLLKVKTKPYIAVARYVRTYPLHKTLITKDFQPVY